MCQTDMLDNKSVLINRQLVLCVGRQIGMCEEGLTLPHVTQKR